MTSTIQNLFDLEGITVTKTEVTDSIIHIQGCLSEKRPSCPMCECQRTIFKGKKIRRFRIPPVGSKHGTLEVLIHKNQCNECKHTWWSKVQVAEGKRRMSRAFIAHALDLLKIGTVSEVAQHLDIGWDSVKFIHKNYLENLYSNIDISEVEYISIDEFAIRKGHSYMTVVSDCKSGRIIHAVKGRKAEDVTPFLQELKKKVHPHNWCF